MAGLGQQRPSRGDCRASPRGAVTEQFKEPSGKRYEKQRIDCGFGCRAQRRRLVRGIGPSVNFYKVPPSSTLEDPKLIAWLQARRKKVFLDCKWFDIPTQVRRSVEAAGRVGRDRRDPPRQRGSGRDGLAVAARPKPLIWGVTVLTSFGPDDLAQVGVS